MFSLQDAISDYCSSEYFLFLEPALKEQAEPLLAHFLKEIKGTISYSTIRDTLRKMANLELPVEIRKSLPYLIAEFFGFLAASGRFPQAGEWAKDAKKYEKEFKASFREDGTLRGETYKKKGQEIKPNDPCICGSGKKFKKCCGPLFG